MMGYIVVTEGLTMASPQSNGDSCFMMAKNDGE